MSICGGVHLLIITNQNYKSISKMVNAIVGYLVKVDITYFSYLKKSKQQKQYQELNELSDNFSFEYVPTKQENKEVKLDEYKPMWTKSNSPTYKHEKYLKSRGVSEDDMIKYSIGYCEDGLYSNRIIIPSYDDEGKLNFFIGRDIFDSKLKYRNSPTPKDIIGFELFVNWEEPILLVEGI